ncbi:LptE family protein [Helicobacter sp.]|uniref:LptE family protein n=1 Tax=Helicobacter sp. TaxID=218 RepID=UPI0025BBD1AF|nr:LptE family protein [Helicobacter sp.]MCI5968080.1 LPS assembly lipoprotein LptE [Helicobacter sp.]MDY2584055.1 LptE family protein [Helicobacter sp.]
MMQKIFLILVAFLALNFSACGYKPLAHNTQKTLGDKIYVEVKIDPRDPQNSVALKDELSKSIFGRLHANIVDKENATSIIEVQLRSVSFNSLAENRTGFATFYRCEVAVEFKFINNLSQKMRVFNKRGFYSFSLNESSIITDSVRLEAINRATLQALDGFISQIGIEGH